MREVLAVAEEWFLHMRGAREGGGWVGCWGGGGGGSEGGG